MVQLLWHICCQPRPGNYELQSSVTLSRFDCPTHTRQPKRIRGGGTFCGCLVIMNTHVHICITTPGRRLFTCQVRGLKSVTDGDLTRKLGAGENNEYAEKLKCEGLEQKLKWEWQNKVEGGFGGGHRVMRGLNATNAMSQSLIKTSSGLPWRSTHTQTHLCIVAEACLNGWSR